MFKIGDKVSQVFTTKTIRKGDIGTVCNAHQGFLTSQNYYEVEFPTINGLQYRLRYEPEIVALTPAQVAALNGQLMAGTPLYKVNDQVTCIRTASSYWSQSGKVLKVDTSVSPWVYTVGFACRCCTSRSGSNVTQLHEKDLIASTRPMPQSPAQHAAAAKSLRNPMGGMFGGGPKLKPDSVKPFKSKGPCCCGALHTSNPNCHAHWCDAS